jgi:hypothetical protein
MKQLAALTITLLVLTDVHAQQNLKEHYAVSAQKMNVMYVGIYNPITIAVSNTSEKNLYVTSDNGIITGGNGVYNVMPSSKGELQIAVYVIKKKDTLFVGKEIFRAKEIPEPTVHIAGKKGNFTLKRNALLAQQALIAFYENLDFGLFIKINSFEMLTYVDGEQILLQSSSNMITPEMKQIFQNCKAGSTFIFQKVIVSVAGATPYELKAKTVVVVE